MSRFQRLVALGTVLGVLLPGGCGERGRTERVKVTPEERPYLYAATETGRWLRSVAVKTAHGTVWPSAAGDPERISPWLGDGVAGVTLFFLELYRATRDPAWAGDARAGADYLRAAVPARIHPEELEGPRPVSGLYHGWAGVGFTLAHAHRVLGDEKDRQGALRCVDLLAEAAHPHADGIVWAEDGGVRDGNAGSGLFLLYAAERLESVRALDLAEAAGRASMAQARADSGTGGVGWPAPGVPGRIDPTFARGTAGVGYFLATLHWATRNDRFLKGALGAGRLLVGRARGTPGDGLLVPVAPGPGADSTFALGWADGAVGTARLFHRLARITGDPQWSELYPRSARGIRASGVPDGLAPGFDPRALLPGREHGRAGVASFLLRLYDETGKEEDLALARRLADGLLREAVVDTRGRRWTVAREEDVGVGDPSGSPSSPGVRHGEDVGIAFTGYLEGAAGIGLLLLQLDAVLQGADWDFALPDDPFGADMTF